MEPSVTQTYDIALESYNAHIAKGTGATSDVFWLTIDGTDLRYLVQTTAIPAVAREPIEGFGPNGVQYTMAGRYKNIAEIPVSFKEVITGEVLQALKEWVFNGEYKNVTLEAAGNTWKLKDCWLEMEQTELSYEDNTLVKPSGTLHVNFIEKPEAGMSSN